MAEFRYLTAAEWGMTWKRPAVPEKLLDPEAYVHHSAGGRISTDAIKAFQFLNRYAQEGKGYSALDYDILVHRDTTTGLITIGGGREEWMSAATLDRNEQGEAICLMGFFHPGSPLSEQPHVDEVEGVARAIVWGIEKGWIARDARILGHRENPEHPGATACPGDYLFQYMPEIRRQVAVMLEPVPVPTPPPVPPTPQETTMIAAIGKCTDGAYLAQFEFRGPIYTVGPEAAHDVTQAEVFGRGAGKAYDIVNGDVVSWSTKNAGSWGAVKEERTQAQVRALMTGN